MAGLRSVKHCYRGPETARSVLLFFQRGESLSSSKAMTTIPTIHLNGTGKDTLTAEYYAAYKAIKESINTLLDATLNGRDFYPQGTDAFIKLVKNVKMHLASCIK